MHLIEKFCEKMYFFRVNNMVLICQYNYCDDYILTFFILFLLYDAFDLVLIGDFAISS